MNIKGGTLGNVPDFEGKKKRVHFVGVGGIGMSAIARILLQMGHEVSGSDLETSRLTEALESLGGAISSGHKASNVPKGADLVVYSSSINSANPEMRQAKRLGVPIVRRACALAGLLNPRRGIAITGTHGKTTTTSLISTILSKAGFDPTIAIGGEIDHIHSNACLGEGAWMVAEADESDGSFLHLAPFYTVVTNIEMEHVDYYKTLDKAIDGYSLFVNKTKRGGVLFCNNDDANIKKMLKRYKGEVRSYGLSNKALIYPVDIKMDGFSTSYKCVWKGKPMGRVNLRIPGMHNVSNSLAAILVGLEAGIDFEKIASSVAGFRGAKRRFELKVDDCGIMLIDDYAHHPTEIKAVIEAAARFRPNRLISIFQPHRFTRTKYLRREFGSCFRGVDRLILTDIFPASEKPIKGVTIKTLYDEAKEAGLKNVEMVKKDEISSLVFNSSRPGDMIVVMGAGDIKNVSEDLEKRFRMRSEFSGLKGKTVFSVPLSGYTTFRIGGKADLVIEPINLDELAKVIKRCRSNGWNMFVIGNGSNLLARDDGYRGVVVRLASPYFKALEIKGNRVRVGAGCSLSGLIRRTCEEGLGGLESLVGIPGTVGGAVFMNAGGAANPLYPSCQNAPGMPGDECHNAGRISSSRMRGGLNRTIGEFVTSVKAIDFDGNLKTMRDKDLAFGYRSSGLSGYIILEAVFRLTRSLRTTLLARLSDFLRLKKSKQVLDAPSAGCIFKNPPGSPFTAGQLIDMMGFKGARSGGALVSTKHANFIINAGRATSRDVLELIDVIRDKAKEEHGVDLEPEVRIL